MVPVILLDRDGTLIEDTHYPRDPSKIRWLAGVPEALNLLQTHGYRLVVVSNQSGVGRGLITYEQFLAVHQRFAELVEQAKIQIDEYHYCFDHPDRPSDFRKPAGGMAPQSWKGQPIDWKRSFSVGDRLSDVQLGLSQGVSRSYLVRTGLGVQTEKDLTSSLEAQALATVLVRRDLLEIAKELTQ